jgi:hypothetical protein
MQISSPHLFLHIQCSSLDTTFPSPSKAILHRKSDLQVFVCEQFAYPCLLCCYCLFSFYCRNVRCFQLLCVCSLLVRDVTNLVYTSNFIYANHEWWLVLFIFLWLLNYLYSVFHGLMEQFLDRFYYQYSNTYDIVLTLSRPTAVLYYKASV